MEKIGPYLKYINIILAVVVISTIIALYVFISGINIFYAPNLEILFLILPCIFGGIAAGLITPGIRGVIWGIAVGALSLCIWSSIFITLETIIIGPDLGAIVWLIIWIPGALLIGGVLGIIGGTIGFVVNYSGLLKKKDHNG